MGLNLGRSDPKTGPVHTYKVGYWDFVIESKYRIWILLLGLFHKEPKTATTNPLMPGQN